MSFFIERKDCQVKKKIFDPTVFNGETRRQYWFVAPLQNSNEIFILKSSSDGGNFNRFWVGRNVYGFRQKRKINDFQIKITDDLE